MFVISAAFSQDAKVKPADTVRSKYLPTGLRLGTDLITLIKSRATQNFTGWEANADVDFYRYYLAVDYGTWSRRDSIVVRPLPALYTPTTKGKYENHGHYFRVGMDINFLLKDPDHNMFFIGFRYGVSYFGESLNYRFPDNYYGIITKSLTENNLTGHWAEITIGIRIKIFPGFWMGYTGRLKLAPGVSGGDGQLLAHDIPGYGLASHANYWGFNYQLFWRIPLRKIK